MNPTDRIIHSHVPLETEILRRLINDDVFRDHCARLFISDISLWFQNREIEGRLARHIMCCRSQKEITEKCEVWAEKPGWVASWIAEISFAEPRTESDSQLLSLLHNRYQARMRQIAMKTAESCDRRDSDTSRALARECRLLVRDVFHNRTPEDFE